MSEEQKIMLGEKWTMDVDESCKSLLAVTRVAQKYSSALRLSAKIAKEAGQGTDAIDLQAEAGEASPGEQH